MGLALFSKGSNSCDAPTLADISASGVELNQSTTDADAELAATAAVIKQKINSIQPIGGTPTAASLSMLGGYDRLLGAEREDFVLLLTDGLPNCNSSLSGATCECVAASCADARNCLDKDAAVAAAQSLKSKGIRTIVVGFGADTAAGTAPGVLAAVAEAGGFPRSCANGTDAECAPGTCNQATKMCSTKFYQAADGAALVTALNQIGILVGGDPCDYTLDASPSDPRFLSVIIDGVSTSSGPDTWSLNAGKVTFTGALCSKLSNATPLAPVKVEFRIVQGL
jgi:hypothetical protein